MNFGLTSAWIRRYYLKLTGGTLTGSLTAPTFISTGAANTVKEYSANSGSAITIDPANGECQYITLNAATPVITFAAAPAAGTSKKIKLTLIQDGTGGRLPTFANCTFLATGSSTATAINSAISSLTYFEADAINGAWVVASADQNLGVIDGSVAAAGYVGEVVTASTSSVSLTTATAKTIGSITLTPGNWTLKALYNLTGASSAILTRVRVGFSLTTDVLPTMPAGGFQEENYTSAANTIRAGFCEQLDPISITSTTTFYLVAAANFAAGTITANSKVKAERNCVI